MAFASSSGGPRSDPGTRTMPWYEARHPAIALHPRPVRLELEQQLRALGLMWVEANVAAAKDAWDNHL